MINVVEDFIKLDKRIFEEKELDITTINSEEELVDTINSLDLVSSNMYKIILNYISYILYQTHEANPVLLPIFSFAFRPQENRKLLLPLENSL